MAIPRGSTLAQPTGPLPGGQILGVSRPTDQFWPLADVRYSAEVMLPNGDRIEFLDETPLRNLIIPGDRIRPALVGSPCTALFTRGRAWLLVFGEELEGFDCDQGDPLP